MNIFRKNNHNRNRVILDYLLYDYDYFDLLDYFLNTSSGSLEQPSKGTTVVVVALLYVLYYFLRLELIGGGFLASIKQS